MNNQLQPISPFDAIRRINEQGQEYWSARDLQNPLGYSKWQDFDNAIQRAKIACENSGHNPDDNFMDVHKPIISGKGREQEIEDYHLSRFACYLTAMNGDPRKPEIAAAQMYFAIKTREAETQQAQAAPARQAELPFDFTLHLTVYGPYDIKRNQEILAHLEQASQLLHGHVEQVSNESRQFTDASKPQKSVKLLEGVELERTILRSIKHIEKKDQPPTIRDIYHYLPHYSRNDIRRIVLTFVKAGLLAAIPCRSYDGTPNYRYRTL